jgi:laminin alpha 3/5
VQVEFEYGNEQQLAKVLPGVYDNSTGLVYLDQTDSMIDVNGKVPHPGQYVFVVHYYQPNHPGKWEDILKPYICVIQFCSSWETFC